MLRSGCLVVCSVVLAALLIGALAGWPTLPAAILPALLLLGLLVEQYVYQPIRPDPPGVGWEQTGERFIDPHSGQGVVVYYNPRSGERRYVAGQG